MLENRNSNEQQTNSSKRFPALMPAACILLILAIVITTVVLCQQLQVVAADNSNVIDLVPPREAGGDTGTGAVSSTEAGGDTISGPPETQEDGAASGTGETGAPSAPSAANPPAQENHPDFSAGDAQQVWTTDTQVEIFHIAYDENGEVTVSSHNGDKVFAPGTANSYTFQFKNNGDVALDYSMTVTAFISPEEIHLPIQARMNRYDGTWLVGSEEDWTPVLELDGVTDQATLGVSHYACYTLDWQWPFETADETGSVTAGDAYDTWLGNLAVDSDITLTIVIHVVATANEDPNAGGGVPQTGDNSHFGIFLFLLLFSGSFLVLLIAFRGRILRDRPQKQPQWNAGQPNSSCDSPSEHKKRRNDA